MRVLRRGPTESLEALTGTDPTQVLSARLTCLKPQVAQLKPEGLPLWGVPADFTGLRRVGLCSPMNCSPPGSSVHGILQAKMLEGVATPSAGDLPDPGIEPGSPALTTVPPGKPQTSLAVVFTFSFPGKFLLHDLDLS